MKVRELFLAALDIDDPAARQAHLRVECADDAELLARVESLLASHAGQSQFLNTPVVEQIAEVSEVGAAATILSGNGSTQDDEPDAAAPYSHGPDAMTKHQDDEDDEIPLGYLEPSSKPDSLGRLAHYEVLEVIGRGAFGTVLRAFDDKLHRVVAIKVMALELAATSPARKRFLREAQASAAIRHEHVVSIHAVEEKPIPYLVMEYIPGETLQKRLDERGPLNVPTVLRIGRQIAEGLAAAHAQDLIHRDIKPANILLETGAREMVKVTDFGLARAADDASLTQSGTIAGTPMYMAPEQVMGHKLDPRADLFSFGSVLYQMVSGRPPFRAPSALAVLKRVTEETPRPISEIIPETPDWLCGIIAKLHAKNPDERFQTAREVADLLADCEAKLKAKQEVRIVLLATARPAGRKWVAGAAVLMLPVLALAVMEFAGVTQLFRQQATRANPGDGPSWPPGPFTDADVKRIAAKQVEEVRKELMQRNPGYDGNVGHTIEDGVVTELRIVTDKVTNISPIQVFNNLRALDCRGTHTPGGRGNGQLADLTPLKGMNLVGLIELRLEWTKVGDAGLAHFKECKNLTHLLLAATHVSDEGLVHFKDSSNLVDLQLQGTLVSDAGLAHFKDSKNLRNLNLGFTQVGDAGLANFQDCKNLTHLHLESTQVSDAGLAHLKDRKNLTYVALYDTQVSDAGLVHLNDCKNLTWLTLQKTKITAAGIDELKKALPKCKIEWDGGVIESKR